MKPVKVEIELKVVETAEQARKHPIIPTIAEFRDLNNHEEEVLDELSYTVFEQLILILSIQLYK